MQNQFTHIGVPGDFVLGLFDRFEKHPDIELICTAGEEGAAFAADAEARLNGLGVVMITYGVGALKILNAIGVSVLDAIVMPTLYMYYICVWPYISTLLSIYISFPPIFRFRIPIYTGCICRVLTVLVISGAPGIKEEGHDTLIHHSIYKQEDSVQRRMFQEGKLGEVYIE